MKKRSFLYLLPITVFVLTGCTIKKGSSKKDPEPEPIKYADWPTADVAQLVQTVKPGCTDVVPAFTKATSIEVDSSTLAEEEYFGVYCKTEDANSENEYKAVLENSSWTVKTEKTGIFYDAFSPNEQLWMNFGYDSNLKELNICICECPVISWPSTYINESIKAMLPTATDTIPTFTANTYVATYYPEFKRLAINGYGVDTNITSTYKTKIEGLNWTTRAGDSDDYYAVSPSKQLEINFYYNSDKDEFNVDVAVYVAPVEGWPYEEIATIVSNMGATGTVLPYTGTNKGFSTDTDYNPPIVKVATATDQEAIDGVVSYNQALLDAGYEKSIQVYGEDTYVYPGTTLIYRATHLTSKIITIELFNLNDF